MSCVPNGSLIFSSGGTVRFTAPDGTDVPMPTAPTDTGLDMAAGGISLLDTSEGPAGIAELSANGTAKFFDTQLNLIGTSSSFGGASTNYFGHYFALASSTDVKKFDRTGALVATYTNVHPTGASALVDSFARDVILSGFHGESIIYRYDIFTTVIDVYVDETANSYTLETGGQQLFMARNGNLFAAWNNGTNLVVRRYSLAPALLSTYTISTDYAGGDRMIAMAPPSVDSSSFWVAWLDASQPANTVVVQEIRVSDGAILNSFTKNTVATGYGWDTIGFGVLNKGIGGDTIPCCAIVSSGFEFNPWRVILPDGSMTSVCGTPVDPNAGGTFAMGVLDDGRIWIGAETYFWTYDPTTGIVDGGILFIGFIGGSSGTHLYRIGGLFFPSRVILEELDPNTWTVTRSWQICTGGTVNSWGFSHLAVNSTETIAYYTRVQDPFSPFTHEGYGIVHRWDLTNNVALSDLVNHASVSNNVCGGLQVLADDTIVVGWIKPLTGFGARRYAPDGTLLTTFPEGCWYAAQGQVARGTASSVLVMGPPSVPTAYTTLYEFDINSGAIIDQIDTLDYGIDPFDWDAPFCALTSCCEEPVLIGCVEPEDPTTDPILALLPSPSDTVIYDGSLDSVGSYIAQGGRTGTTIAPSVTGDVWVCDDNNVAPGSVLAEAAVSSTSGTPPLAIGDVIRTVTVPTLLAELYGRHALFDIGCCKLLSVNRDTHEVVEITVEAVDPLDYTIQTGAVTKTYGLVIDPLDAAINSNATRLMYVDGNTLKLWDLEDDQFVRVIKDFGFPIAWPLWVEGFVYVFTGAWGTNADLLKIEVETGNLIFTYTYDPALFPLGLYGNAVALGGDGCLPDSGKLYIAGGVTGTQSGILGINLLDGAVDAIVAVDFPYVTTPFNASGFIAVGEAASGGGDGAGNTTESGLPPMPDVSCSKSSISTVSPNPGCNPGGRGWTPEYTGPSGVVPTVTNPATPESWTGKSSIVVEAIIEHTAYDDVAVTEVSETLRYAVVELDDTQLKEGRVRSIGAIEKGAGDAQGNLQAATIDIRINDDGGRPLGTRMEGLTTRYFARDEIRILGRSDEGRRSGATPKYIGRGLLTGESYSLTSGTAVATEARLTAMDVLFADGGAFSPDKKVPQWVFPTSYYIDAPPDVATLFMPIILGEVSDNGALNPETGLPSERGKCPARYMGIDPLGTGPLGAAEDWGRFNACLFAIYKITGLYGSDLGGMGIYGRSVISNGGKPNSVLSLDGTPDLTAVPLGGYAQIVIYTIQGRQELRIVGKGASTVTVSGQVDPVLVDGSSWYISYISYIPRRVKIDLTTRNGDDCMVPKWPSFIRPTDYEEFIADGDTYRVTDFWVRGPLLDVHLAGEVTLAFNAIGIEDQGDSTGLPIDDFFTAENWFIDNCVHRQLQAPSAAGGTLWPQTDGDLPMFVDGVHKTKQSSFARAQAISNGLKISAYFNEGASIRDVVQLFNDNSGSRLYIDEYGRIGVWKFDPYDDQSLWPVVDHVSRAFGDVERVRAHDEILNVIKGGCEWDPDAGKFREEIDPPITSVAAIRHNKGIKKYSKHIDGKLVARRAQFVTILEQKLADFKDGAVYVRIQNCDVGMLDYPVGTGIRFTSVMGPGALGWVHHPLVILRSIFDIDSQMVTLHCLEVGDDGPAENTLIANGAVVSPGTGGLNEAVHVVGTLSALTLPLTSTTPSESLKITQTITARLNPDAVSRTESLKLRDTVTAARTGAGTIQDTIKIAESLSATLIDMSGNARTPVIGEAFAGDGSTVAFVLAHTPLAGLLAAYVNGVRVTTFSVAGATVTFAVAPALGDEVSFDYFY